MRVEIRTHAKKKGGKYYSVVSVDKIGATHIWGRYKNKTDAFSKKNEVERAYE